MYWRHWCLGCCFSTLMESCIVNPHLYTYLLLCVPEDVPWKFPEKWCTANWFLCHNKALASDTLSLSQFQPQTVWYSLTPSVLQKSIPMQLFSVVNKFILKGKKFVYLIAIRIKLMTVLADFKTQDFQRASSYGRLALLTVSSCKGTALKRTAQNNF